jgi:hypothetical protein
MVILMSKVLLICDFSLKKIGFKLRKVTTQSTGYHLISLRQSFVTKIICSVIRCTGWSKFTGKEQLPVPEVILN